MARPQEQLSAQRLFEASEAVLLAIVEIAERASGEWLAPATVMGTSLQPACLDEFSRFEVEQATDFLVRLGILERSRGRPVR